MTTPNTKNKLVNTFSDTIHFENPRIAQQIFNNDIKNIQFLEKHLNVKATAREGWIKIEGSQESVNKAKQFLLLLENSLKAGRQLKTQDFTYALEVFESNGLHALQQLHDVRILTSNKKPQVTPKTLGQQQYIQAIKSNDIVFGIGPAGTGKTYLAVAMALSSLRESKCSRIILTRPAVEAGEALGFLPGDLYEKITPYLRPLYDALYDMLPAEDVQKYIERGIIEIAPLAYMRGRTLNNAFIILDEAQNSTHEQMLMFLTRLGNNSKAVITGDPTQIDLPSSKRSGLVEAVQILNNINGIEIVEFQKSDVIRHPLVQKIITAYENFKNEKSNYHKP